MDIIYPGLLRYQTDSEAQTEMTSAHTIVSVGKAKVEVLHHF